MLGFSRREADTWAGIPWFIDGIVKHATGPLKKPTSTHLYRDGCDFSCVKRRDGKGMKQAVSTASARSVRAILVSPWARTDDPGVKPFGYRSPTWFTVVIVWIIEPPRLSS